MMPLVSESVIKLVLLKGSKNETHTEQAQAIASDLATLFPSPTK